jgi:hypothetical protein
LILQTAFGASLSIAGHALLEHAAVIDMVSIHPHGIWERRWVRPNFRAKSRYSAGPAMSGSVLARAENSPNVISAIDQAAKQDLKTIGLAGKDGGSVAQAVDVSIVVASTNVARVRECHITIGHVPCELLENGLS